jgi:NTE family protein
MEAKTEPASDQTDKTKGHPVDLVFEGGGVKGIALVGALSVLEEAGYQRQNVAGTSAGAIVAALLGAGYTSAELHNIMRQMRFSDFMDQGWEDRVPMVGTPLGILKDQGIYEGAVFLRWITGLLEAKSVHTFADLVHPQFAADERFRYKVQVIASDLTEKRLLVLPRDAETLGIASDELRVADAVRMSMSIPIFFEPVRRKNDKTGLEHVIVDGGMLSNFPVWLFDSDGEPDWPTFGLKLGEQFPRENLANRLPEEAATQEGIRGIVGFLKSLVATMTAAHDRLYLEQADFVRTMFIPTLGVKATDFGLSPDTAEALFESGRSTAREFLKSWDFDAYIAGFRRQAPPSRRQQVVDYMGGV